MSAWSNMKNQVYGAIDTTNGSFHMFARFSLQHPPTFRNFNAGKRFLANCLKFRSVSTNTVSMTTEDVDNFSFDISLRVVAHQKQGLLSCKRFFAGSVVLCSGAMSKIETRSFAKSLANFSLWTKTKLFSCIEFSECRSTYRNQSSDSTGHSVMFIHAPQNVNVDNEKAIDNTYNNINFAKTILHRRAQGPSG